MSFLAFTEGTPKPKTRTWTIQSTMGGGELGTISWYAPWRKYTYHSLPGLVFDSKCLKEIVDFLDKANSDHKAK